ncbi:helix-turn-helix domain-containing protein [Virgibacillus sp. Bac332]|uniref:helix-turn-helix domain-containing protein n=1 Tax=Virgibacillus sp. Bac332 TaxID=2419842 RepID=UPI000EF4F318|nr:helix-turn-helix transcriptional regulator [Virgibacillus sp. Bac332]
MSDIGKLLIELRGKESLREASKRIGISHTYLDTIEKGFDKRSGKVVKPSPDTLRLISNAYNYPYIKLLRLAGYIDEAKDEEEFEAFRNDPSLERWYRELPKNKEEDLKRLKKIWEAFKEEE